MLYTDGSEAMLGDEVAISGNYRGVVVASMDHAEYSAAYPEAQWAYLRKRVLMETDFGGLVHYEDSEHEHFALIRRAKEVLTTRSRRDDPLLAGKVSPSASPITSTIHRGRACAFGIWIRAAA